MRYENKFNTSANDQEMRAKEYWGYLTGDQLAEQLSWRTEHIIRLRDTGFLTGLVDHQGVIRYSPSEYLRFVEGEVEN